MKVSARRVRLGLCMTVLEEARHQIDNIPRTFRRKQAAGALRRGGPLGSGNDIVWGLERVEQQ